MIAPIQDSIASTIATLNRFSEIVAREPAFQHWHCSGEVSPNLIQLFPASDETPFPERQQQARAIARAFGGQWARDVHDGSWHNRGTGHYGDNPDTFRVIIHRVDFYRRDANPFGPAIDLSAPEIQTQTEEAAALA